MSSETDEPLKSEKLNLSDATAEWKNQSKRRSSITSKRPSKGTVLQLSLTEEGSTVWKEEKPKHKKFSINFYTFSSYLEKSRTADFRLKLTIVLLFILILGFMMTTSYFFAKQKTFIALKDKIYILEEIRRMNLLNSMGDKIATLYYGAGIPEDISPINCFSLSKTSFCRDWKYRANLILDYYHKANDISCYHFFWKGHDSHITLRDCIDLDDGFWYGVGIMVNSSWPLNKLNHKLKPFVTSHQPNPNSLFTSTIKRYWISSKGINIMVPVYVPLYVSFNSSASPNQLCLESRIRNYPYNYFCSNPVLEYTVCTGPEAINLHLHTAKKWMRNDINGTFRDEDISESIFLQKPIWTIAPHLMPKLNYEHLENFSTSVINYGIDPGILLLDSRWQKNIGDLVINNNSFPEQTFFKLLERKGFKIILTVEPLIEIGSIQFQNASSDKRMLLATNLDQVPLLTKYNGTFCGVLNLLNDTTCDWFINNLKPLRNNSIHGIFFKGLPSTKIPRFDIESITNLDEYQVHYHKIAESLVDSNRGFYIGTDTVADFTHFRGFVKINPLSASWNDLKKIIPSVLSLSLVGYPVIATGPVGGDFGSPSLDLYIRWFELSTFLPVLQLSDLPKNDISAVKLAKKCINIRETQVIPLLKKYMAIHYRTGAPIIRPIWWIDTDSKASYTIDDQFAIGEEMIVAPILEENKTQRDIYLPKGYWKNEIIGTIEKGGKWLREYVIEQNQVAYFTKSDLVR